VFSGQAWITGFAQYVVDAEDPFPEGFMLGDILGHVKASVAQGSPFKPCGSSTSLPSRGRGDAFTKVKVNRMEKPQGYNRTLRYNLQPPRLAISFRLDLGRIDGYRKNLGFAHRNLTREQGF
jgi:hypothetical protein